MDTHHPTLDSIVVAAEWSEKTRAVAHRAALLGRRHGARGVLLHVRSCGLVDLMRGVSNEDCIRFQRERLGELAESVHDRTGFRFETQVHRTLVSRRRAIRHLVGDAALAIVENPLRWGMRGRAWPVLRDASRPVLLVRREPVADYRRVLVLVDLHEPCVRSFGWIRAIAADAEIALLAVLDQSAENRLRLARADEESIVAARQQRREEAYRALAALASAAGLPERSVLRMVEHGYPPLLLQHMEARLQADLLVLLHDGCGGMRRYFFHDAVAEAVQRSACDVLLLPKAGRQAA